MRIILTGANGFIGKSLLVALKNDYSIFPISRKFVSDEGWLCIDLSDRNSLDVIDIKADVIIHCASVLATKENSDNISLLYENLFIAESVIALVEKSEATVFINLSSMAVYENASGSFCEDDKINPSSNFEGLYGLSKFCSEELFNYFLRKNGVRTIDLRLAQVIGDGMRDDRVFSMMRRELELKNQVTVFGDGSRTSSFISISYLVETIRKIIVDDSVNGIYNLSEYDMSYKEMAENILKTYGNQDSVLSFSGTLSGRKFSMNSDKLKNILNK
jgi:nucleoside-diphosphate-sugar epimerase